MKISSVIPKLYVINFTKFEYKSEEKHALGTVIDHTGHDSLGADVHEALLPDKLLKVEVWPDLLVDRYALQGVGDGCGQTPSKK
jgi:hypothetical protein